MKKEKEASNRQRPLLRSPVSFSTTNKEKSVIARKIDKITPIPAKIANRWLREGKFWLVIAKINNDK